MNLTDGLDGLAIVPVIIAALSFGMISYLAGNALFADYLQIHYVAGTGELAVLCGAVIGAGLGFLWYNAPPASIFMGDTGSLALGGLIGTIAVATKHEIALAIIGGLFVLEAVSVIVQVVSFRLFGKRVFRMAPIHHHYEQKGWTEPQIVIRFWIISDHAGADRAVDAQAAMIPVTSLRRKDRRGLRPRRLGACDLSALIAGGAEVIAFDDDAEESGAGRRREGRHRRSAQHRLVDDRGADPHARRAADASGAALVGEARDSEPASRSSAMSNCSAASAASTRRTRRSSPSPAPTANPPPPR